MSSTSNLFQKQQIPGLMPEESNMTFNEIATIRDILVGSQMKNVAQQLADLQQLSFSNIGELKAIIENLKEEITTLKQETNHRLEELENTLKTTQAQSRSELLASEKRNTEQLSNTFLDLGKKIGQGLEE